MKRLFLLVVIISGVTLLTSCGLKDGTVNDTDQVTLYVIMNEELAMVIRYEVFITEHLNRIFGPLEEVFGRLDGRGG